jgi:hypothetical protein
VGDDEVEAGDLVPEVAADLAGADDPAGDDYWPTGEPKLSPTAMWMEHKGWAS